MNLSELLKAQCTAALNQAYPDKANSIDSNLIEITPATQEKFGHYQCNSAMKLAKILGENPRKIAENLVSKLQTSNTSSPDTSNDPVFAELSIAGPGFINFTLHPRFLSKIVTQQLHDARLGVPLPAKPLKVIVDYSSPNVAKEMHVGHLRTTIIGDCLARLMRFLGHDVLCLNHIGDWGTQFGMLIAYLKILHPEMTGTTLPPVHLSNLVAWYRAAKLKFDEEADFKKQSQQEVVALQNGDPTATRIWKHICEISRRAYQEIYDILDIQLIERGESFYHPYLAPLLEDLKNKNLITVSDGAQCVYLDGFTNREGEPLPLILQKSDGGYNYATTDMAALRHRVQEEKGNWLIYVIDAGQSLHLQMIFETAKKAGYYDPTQVRLDHAAFGLVLKPDGKKFKTRSGDTERLIDLLQGAIEKAKEKLQERDPGISNTELETSAHILGINAVKYADLSCHRMSDYVFSYDKMLKFEGNTAAFLLYAYVRVQSIQRKVNVNVLDLLKDQTPVSLEEPAEIALGLLITQFSEELDTLARELLPNRLTDYLYRVAEKFHVFFHQCRVEGSLQQNSRLLLCEATARVLYQGMQILGLKPLQRM
jgi:arginyl-tRNA synthetase